MRRRRPWFEVVAAWVLTGPPGHLYAGVADWSSVLLRFARARGRLDRM